MRTVSPIDSPVFVPWSHRLRSPKAGLSARVCCTGMAFHSARAGTASTVSKVCAVSSWPGTLCTRVPTGMVTGSRAMPGALVSVKARCVLAATPGAGR